MAPRISPEDVVWAHAGGELCFQRGTVVRLDPHKGTVSVRIKSGIIDAKEADVHKTNSDKQDGVPDNTYLRELNEATLLHKPHTSDTEWLAHTRHKIYTPGHHGHWHCSTGSWCLTA